MDLSKPSALIQQHVATLDSMLQRSARGQMMQGASCLKNRFTLANGGGRRGCGPAIAVALPFSLLSGRKVRTMNTKLLVSLGSTLAATKLAQSVSQLEANDILGLVGLARRRSYLLENLALIGIGAIAGAGAALLFAPASGSETRERMAYELGKVKEKTAEALRDAKRQAPAMLQQMKDAAKNEVGTPSYST